MVQSPLTRSLGVYSYRGLHVHCHNKSLSHSGFLAINEANVH